MSINVDVYGLWHVLRTKLANINSVKNPKEFL